MENIYVGLIVTLAVIISTLITTLIVLGYFKWKEYKLRRIGLPGQGHLRRHHLGSRSHSRRNSRARRVRVRNANSQQTLQNTVQIVMHPPPYSAIDNDAPPPYTPNGVLTPTRWGSMANRPSACLTPRPLPEHNENTLAIHQQHLRTNRLSTNTGSTSTPMTTPAGSMFTTSIGGGTRDTSASSNMRSVNMVHIENNRSHRHDDNGLYDV